MSNHLGNVLAVVSDKKEQSDGVVWSAVVLSAQDYYPFGMSMPGRSTDAKHRYGFNGQERDIELGENIYTAEFWEYDARLGRRWNRDPVRLPWLSPYATFENNPIVLNDPNGDTAGDPQKPATNECPECGESSMLKEVVVTAKRPPSTFDKMAAKASNVVENIQRGAQKVANNLKEPAVTFAAATDAFVSDMLLLYESRNLRQLGFLEREPIETVTYNGRKYILDGHHRMEAAKRANYKPRTQKLSEKEAWQRYPDKMKDIIEGNF